jgi:ABC-2 type transport system permease protein
VIDTVAAEWLKLRSVQSTFYALFAVAMFVPMAGLLAWQTATAWDAADAARRAELATMRPEDGLLMFVQLAIAALGVLAITSEYATGTIRTTFVAVPRRGVVLGAKSLVVGAVALVAGQVSVLAMFWLSRLVVGDREIPLYSTAFGDEVPRLLALGLSVMVVGLLGLGLGVLTRSTTGALTMVAALLFVFPTMGRLLPAPWDDRFTAVTLPQLPLQLAGADDAYLSPPGALAALAAYILLALAAAHAALRRRDA